MTAIELPAIEHVVMQHAEEAAFLWLLRELAGDAPHYSLDDLGRLDERIDAHLDGLRVSGRKGWTLSVEALAHGEASEVFAAAVLALESGEAEWQRTVCDAVVETPATAPGLASALGRVSRDCAAARLGQLLGSTDPTLRGAAIAGAVAQGLDPGVSLAEALRAPAPALRARACRAVGQLARVDLASALKPLLQDDDPTCRFHAAWSAALCGVEPGPEALRRMAEAPGPWRVPAAAMAPRCMPLATARAWARELAKDPGGARAAVAAAGAAGDAALVPWLVERMAEPALARTAAEAFTLITGAALDRLKLTQPAPADFVPGPTDDAEDEDVALDPDERLPWPDAEGIARWWAAHRPAFAPEGRYLLGRPNDAEGLRHVLRHGLQRQRAAAAMELALRTPDLPLFDVRALAERQRTLLGPASADPVRR